MDTRLTVTCMISMMYNEAEIHIVLLHWHRLGSFSIVFFKVHQKLKFSVCDSRCDGKFSSMLSFAC